MSPGRVARPSGIFSVHGITPTTGQGGVHCGARRPKASNVPITAAAPDMSPFISAMFAAGLRLIPPLSKVMPLPTSATGLPSAPLGAYSRTTSRGSRSAPRATARNAPMLRSSSSFGPSTRHFIPYSAYREASSAAVDAIKTGVTSLAGPLAKSRARYRPAASASARRTASCTASSTCFSRNRKAIQRGSAGEASFPLSQRS